MLYIEKELREALALMDSVPVAGREHRKNMAMAETKILAVANALGKAAEKEESGNGHAENEQGNDAQG